MPKQSTLKRWLSASILLGLSLGANLQAQDTTQRYSFVLPELRLSPDARFGGMANVGIAMPSDPNSLHYNASALAFNPKHFNMGFSYNPDFTSIDRFLNYFSVYKQLGKVSTLGGSFRFISMGTVEADSLINSGQAKLNQAMEVNLAYAHRFGKILSVAVGGKYIQTSLQLVDSTGQFAFRPSNAFAFDVSATLNKQFRIKSRPAAFRAGLAFTNVGSKLQYTTSPQGQFLPANAGLGLSFEYRPVPKFSLVLASDINKLMVPSIVPEFNADGSINPDFDANGNGIPDYMEQNVMQAFFRSFGDDPLGQDLKEFLYSFGLEMRFNQRWFTRFGFQGQDYLLGLKERLAGGIGARFGLINLNLAYSRQIEAPKGDLGMVNISLILDLSGVGRSGNTVENMDMLDEEGNSLD